MPMPGRPMRRKAKMKWAASPLMVVIGLFLAAGVLLYRFAPNDPDPVDVQTMCAGAPSSVTAVLLDVTDPLSESQQGRVRKELESVLNAVPPKGRVEVFLLAKGQVGVPKFTICNPGDGSERPAFFVTQSVAKALWRENFRDKVLAAAAEAQRAEGSDTSGVLEAIASVCSQAFSGEGENPPKGKRLIVFSDMLQHTRGLNQYSRRQNVGFQTFRTWPYYEAVRPTNIGGVDVSVFYIRRPQNAQRQGAAHMAFWRALFEERCANATFTEI